MLGCCSDSRWPLVELRSHSWSGVRGGVRDVYVALHALNYRFSFTEKGQRGDVSRKYKVGLLFIHLYLFFPAISCLSVRVSPVTLGILKLSLRWNFIWSYGVLPSFRTEAKRQAFVFKISVFQILILMRAVKSGRRRRKENQKASLMKVFCLKGRQKNIYIYFFFKVAPVERFWRWLIRDSGAVGCCRIILLHLPESN